MALNKYACCIAHIWLTALLLKSTYRPSITIHIGKKNEMQLQFTMSLPYTFQQQICPSNATYMSYAQITQYAVMGKVCQYIYGIDAVAPINDVARIAVKMMTTTLIPPMMMPATMMMTPQPNYIYRVGYLAKLVKK